MLRLDHITELRAKALLRLVDNLAGTATRPMNLGWVSAPARPTQWTVSTVPLDAARPDSKDGGHRIERTGEGMGRHAPLLLKLNSTESLGLSTGRCRISDPV